VVVADVGLRVLVQLLLHLKYGAAAVQDLDTAVTVVDAIWQTVPHLEDITVKKQLEELTDSLTQDVVIHSV
jgi:hypothetical protein